MRAWINAGPVGVVTAVVVSGLLLGCGAAGQKDTQWGGSYQDAVTPSDDAQVQPSAQELTGPVTNTAPKLTRSEQPANAGTVSLVAPSNNWTVNAHDVAAKDGQSVTVLTGIMGCGWMETGRGVATAQDGAFTTTLVRTSKDFGYETALLFVDVDGDGTCDAEKGDTVFSVPVALDGHTLTIDGKSLQPTDGWECMVINRPPEPTP